MVELLEKAEHLAGPAVRWLRFLIELSGVLCIAIGFVVAVVALIRPHPRGIGVRFTPIRLAFSRYLSLALEFQLASDILMTALEPTWQDLGKLAATAVIRTALNYFLSKEIKEYRERMEDQEQLDHLPGHGALPAAGEA